MSKYFIESIIDTWNIAHLESMPMTLEDSKTIYRLACPGEPQPIWRSDERFQNMKRPHLRDSIGEVFDFLHPLLMDKGYMLQNLGTANVICSEEPIVTQNRYTFRLLDLSCISDLSNDDIALMKI